MVFSFIFFLSKQSSYFYFRFTQTKGEHVMSHAAVGANAPYFHVYRWRRGTACEIAITLAVSIALRSRDIGRMSASMPIPAISYNNLS